MTIFNWQGRAPRDLDLFAKSIAAEVRCAILGFPDFGCRSTSQLFDLPPRTSPYYARAHIKKSAGMVKKSGLPRAAWLIEFNPHTEACTDIEMVLYHELAHFICYEIEPAAASHGLLWATCYDALHILMELDWTFPEKVESTN